MRRILLHLCLCLSASIVYGQQAAIDNPEYYGLITQWTELAAKYPQYARLSPFGTTDSGEPLLLFIIDAGGHFEPSGVRSEKIVCLIINGIHAGEPDGMLASLHFAEAVLKNPPGNITYCIIPAYSPGGALQRNSTSRVNQNGPAEYGFRGNALNLDLNRDFSKADSQNTLAFYRIFHKWKPHILIDTHTTNGADYQPAISLVHTIPERLHPMQASVLKRDLMPYLYDSMKAKGEEMIPYFEMKGKKPEDGIYSFTDAPRYSSGYAALFNTIAFLTETHMLKPFEKRIKATETFLHTLHEMLLSKGKLIADMKALALSDELAQKSFPTKWRQLADADSIDFPGYETETAPGAATGLPITVYLRDKPYRKPIPWYNQHEATHHTAIPDAYIIPQGWTKVIEILQANGIAMQALEKDTEYEVESAYIHQYSTSHSPYEGHYPHRDISTLKKTQKILFRKGDWYVNTNQPGRRYMAHMLDPAADDSFFKWNFFDAVLSQKEYYSAYLFEQTAADILKTSPSLRKAFDERRKADKEFAESQSAQLDFIYVNSKHYELTHKRIPVFGVIRKP